MTCTKDTEVEMDGYEGGGRRVFEWFVWEGGRVQDYQSRYLLYMPVGGVRQGKHA